MFCYNDAASITESLFTVYARPVNDYFYDWSGSTYRVTTTYDERNLTTLTDACYKTLTNVFARRLNLNEDLHPYARHYIETSVNKKDAVMLVVGITDHDMWLYQVYGKPHPSPNLIDVAWENGLDSMLISYLNGVSLEHILG